MGLVICTGCGHPLDGHACSELLDLGEDGYPHVCGCTRTPLDQLYETRAEHDAALAEVARLRAALAESDGWHQEVQALRHAIWQYQADHDAFEKNRQYMQSDYLDGARARLFRSLDRPLAVKAADYGLAVWRILRLLLVPGDMSVGPRPAQVEAAAAEMGSWERQAKRPLLDHFRELHSTTLGAGQGEREAAERVAAGEDA